MTCGDEHHRRRQLKRYGKRMHLLARWSGSLGQGATRRDGFRVVPPNRVHLPTCAFRRGNESYLRYLRDHGA